MKNIRFHIALLALAGVCLGAMAAIPAGYYSSVDGKRDSELKTAMHKLLYNHTEISSYWNLPDYFRRTDVYPPGNQRYGQWWDMYSNIPLYTDSFNGLNREHSFPKSWWGGSDETPAYVDLNHLYPSEREANMAKSNYPLGEVQTPEFENGITTVGSPVSGQGGGARQVFEPADEYKGDFARTYFYMVTCYQNLTWRYQYMVSNTTYPTLTTWASELLLRWSREDPVSQKELDRNEQVYRVQANRNPFIDFPELAEYIWGNKRGEAFHPTSSGVSGEPVLITPVQDMALEFGETAVDMSNTASLQIRGEYLKTNPQLTLSGADKGMFSLERTSVNASDVNKTDGTWVRVTYKPTSVGEHQARLIVSDYDGSKSRGIALRGEGLARPELHTLTALAATDVTDTQYTARWEEPKDVVDYYIVTRTVYPTNAETYREEQMAEQCNLVITGCQPGSRESYSVQSSRLGFTSDPSNEVYVDLLAGIYGVTGDAQAPMGWRIDGGRAVLALPEGAVVRSVTVYDLLGRVVATIAEATDGAELPVSPGAYIVSAPGMEPLCLRF